MPTGSFIEVISREEFMELNAKMDKLLKNQELLLQITEKQERTELTLSELHRETGYSKQTLRRIINNKHIPFSRQGNDIIISKEFAGQFKRKVA